MGRYQQTRPPARDGGAKKPPCRYFLRGKCRDGDKCKFSHDNHAAGGNKRGEGKVSSSRKTLPANGAKASPAEQSSGPTMTRKSPTTVGGSSAHSVVTPVPEKKLQCLTCVETSAKLAALRSQTESGLQLIGKMESAFSELSKLARSNLERTLCDIGQLEVSCRQTKVSGTTGPPEEIVSGKQAPGIGEGEVQQTPKKVERVAQKYPRDDNVRPGWNKVVGGKEGIDRNGTNSALPSSASKTNDNVLGNDTASGASSSPPVASLDGVIKDYAPFMTGTPRSYMESLCREFSVDGFHASDFVEIYEDCLDVLASISTGTASEEDVRFLDSVLGGIAVGVQRDFCEDVLSAAKAADNAEVAVEGRGSPTSVATDLTKTAEAAPSFIASEKRVLEKKNAQKRAPKAFDGIRKPVAKSKTKPLASATGSGKRAQVAAIGKKLSSLPRKEYSLSSSQKAVPRASGVDKSSVKGTEDPVKIVATDEIASAKEKQKLVSTEQGEQNQTEPSAGDWKTQKQTEYMNSYVCQAEELIALSHQRAHLAAIGQSKTPKDLVKKATVSIDGQQLPSYITHIPAPSASTATIFRLLRNSETVPAARELLRLEEKVQKQRSALTELRRSKAVEENGLKKTQSEYGAFAAEWTGPSVKIMGVEIDAGERGEENRLKKKIEDMKRKAGDDTAQPTLLQRLTHTALEKTQEHLDKLDENKRKKKEARDLAESVKNDKLGIGEAYEKKREAREREIREKEFELCQLQREIEAGDRAVVDADGEEAKTWRTKRRELKALKEMKSKQLEVEVKAADAEEKKIASRRLKDGENEEKKRERAAQALAGLQGRLKDGQKKMEEWPAKIAEKKKVLAKYGARIAAAVKRVNETQAEIQAITGANQSAQFDIETKDERGHTILMHTAQANDPVTASICLQMGADVHAVNPEGLTAIDYSFFFKFEAVTQLILEHGGSLPASQVAAWKFLPHVSPMKANASSSWEETLKTAAIAAVPAEQYLESPESCEMDEAKRMEILSDDDVARMDFTCFEARLVKPKINSDQVHRVVLLDSTVYDRLCTDSADAVAFVGLIKGLMPSGVRGPGILPTKCHRRGIVGTTDTFEVLGARLSSKRDAPAVLFSPFVGGEAEGVSNIGVVVWAIVPDQKASLFKTLLSNTEFLRSKSKIADRFLPHNELCLKLGSDMHLLELTSTSIWTATTMKLYTLNVDKGDLDRVSDSDFHANKRVVYSEELVNRALFGASEDEMNKNDTILAEESADMSSLIRGGAGVGKTLLMIRKVSHEDASKRILVVSRLPRLVNAIKTAVEEKRSDDARHVSFFTYERLMQLLAKRVAPDHDSQQRSFVRFNQVHFDCDEDVGTSFCRQFIGDYLNEREKKAMNESNLEALTLWQAITTIKSHAECAATKMALSLDAYIGLPSRFGLTQPQREVCYDLFEKYERWKNAEGSWDEADRSTYILTHGPSVYRDGAFVPWRDRVNRRGEIDLLDEEGGAERPYFFDMVFADEAQDFTALDQALLLRMSNTRSVFFNIDPAQSVEEGVKMNAKGVNEVFFTHCERGTRVNDVLQIISLKTNHRTHEENLRLATAVRRLLARSFKIPLFEERALIRGKIPKTLRLNAIEELTKVFRGANCVFIAPDEKVPEFRVRFRELGIENDLFGVREAKGLEFDSVALIGFFAYIEERGSGDAWKNALRWLSSSAGITETTTSGEKICGTILEDCDYRLTHPEVSDEAMLLYTALTRARNQLYLIEADCKRGRGVDLANYSFWRLNELELAQSVDSIDEGQEEMTPSQHKARGVLNVVQALSMIQKHEPFDLVRKKFMEATDHFGPNKGNDRPLLVQCRRHLKALEAGRNIRRYAMNALYAPATFRSKGGYNIEGRFSQVLRFEAMANSFFSSFLGDSYLIEVVDDIRCLVEEIFFGTQYEFHFKGICQTIQELGRFV